MKRDLITLISVMKNFIPEEYESVHAELDGTQHSLMFAAPEMEGFYFRETAEILSELPEEKRSSTWMKALISVWGDQKFQLDTINNSDKIEQKCGAPLTVTEMEENDRKVMG